MVGSADWRLKLTGRSTEPTPPCIRTWTLKGFLKNLKAARLKFQCIMMRLLRGTCRRKLYLRKKISNTWRSRTISTPRHSTSGTGTAQVQLTNWRCSSSRPSSSTTARNAPTVRSTASATGQTSGRSSGPTTSNEQQQHINEEKNSQLQLASSTI